MKIAGETLPLGQTLALRNSAAVLYLLIFAAWFGGLSLPRAAPKRAFGWRIAGEIGSTFCFFWALARMPIGDITGLSQITPLAITAAGALFLGERVGARRWLAALAGLAGVLLIVQPGTSAFTWAAVVALIANAFGVLRDLATRVIGPAVPTLTLSISSIFAVMLFGLALAPFEDWRVPELREVAVLLAGGVFLTLGYAFLIISVRMGSLAAVSPFRYSAILWALLSGWLLWGDWPNEMALSGIAIVTAAGLYALHRERLNREDVRP
jgi:drug/metabolite transporter (DMT)-like permease